MTTLLALASTSQAQQVDETIQFIDEQGNVVPDGSVITVSTLDEEGQMVVPLYVKNTSDQKAGVSMYETIGAKPNGDWQTCAFGNCVMLSESGYSSSMVAQPGYEGDIQTEWIPETGKYAEWTATLQIHLFNVISTTQFGVTIEKCGTTLVGYGPTVTIRFAYTDPAGIDAAEAEAGIGRQYYNLRGQRTATGQKGMNIVRLANGSVKKIIVR